MRTLSISRALRERYGVSEDSEDDDPEGWTDEIASEDSEDDDPDLEPIIIPIESARALLWTGTQPELLYLLRDREFSRELRSYVDSSDAREGDVLSSWLGLLSGALASRLSGVYGLPQGILRPDELERLRDD